MDDANSTRYPLLMVPGLLGFICLLGYRYWDRILDCLRQDGHRVFPVLVSPLNSSEVRGEQLLAHIERICQQTGADKVNLIGHSQGALTARYAAGLNPQRVASVTSVAGPNHGSELADWLAVKAPLGSLYERLRTAWMSLLCVFLHWFERGESGERGSRLPIDGRAAQASLTSAGVADFNQRFPQGLPSEWGGQGAEQVDGVYYFSWSGTLQAGLTNTGGNRLDMTHWMCRMYSRAFVRERGQNDGMVGRFSSHLGRVIRSDYPLDHFDIVNQSRGRVGKGIDPVQLYRDHALRLQTAGL